MMGLLLKIILIAIFIYLIYSIFFRKSHSRAGSTGSGQHSRYKSKSNDPVQKRIEESNIEDADYKEVE